MSVIGGDLAGHQFGIGAGHINVGIGIFQQAVDSFFPTVNLLHFVQQQIVAPIVGHLFFNALIHSLAGHSVVKILRRIAHTDNVVCGNPTF